LDEADPEDQSSEKDQSESQVTEAPDNYAASHGSSLAPNDSISQSVALLNIFLEPPKPKRKRKETS